jgi:hypothetical protein
MAGTLSFVAREDARAVASNPDQSFGQGTKLYADTAPAEASYLRFKVEGVTGSVLKASLRMFVTNASRDAPAVYATTNQWAEATLTWNNKPAALGTAISNLGAVAQGQWLNYPLSAAVVKGDGDYDFVLVPETSDGLDVYSKEGPNKPTLVLHLDTGACVPTTCEAQSKNCGELPDGCGGVLTCGVCSELAACGAGGVPNVCGDGNACTPKSCGALEKNCGTVSDGCSGTLQCGTCTGGMTCGGGGIANVCGTPCVPTTCSAQGKNCGSIQNGCGLSLNCGTCVTGSCGGAGVPNVCGTAPVTGIPTDANFKVAVIGDTGAGSAFTSVLNLVKAEGAQALVVEGDMGYTSSASAWFSALDAALGSAFPVFAAVGNHDVSSGWSAYSNVFVPRWKAVGATVVESNVADGMYSVTYKGLFMVFAGQNAANKTTYATYVKNALADDTHIWRTCNWHKNQAAMQVGGKTDEMGWGVYDNCRAAGAVILTGHEHSYSRTKTLISMVNQTVDSTCATPGALCVGPNRSFAVVSGLGGNSIRDQQRCLPSTEPYGCKGEWAKIYSSSQSAKDGVLFLTFNVDGNPKKARGYFKSVSGTTVDTFTFTRD